MDYTSIDNLIDQVKRSSEPVICQNDIDKLRAELELIRKLSGSNDLFSIVNSMAQWELNEGQFKNENVRFRWIIDSIKSIEREWNLSGGIGNRSVMTLLSPMILDIDFRVTCTYTPHYDSNLKTYVANGKPVEPHPYESSLIREIKNTQLRCRIDSTDISVIQDLFRKYDNADKLCRYFYELRAEEVKISQTIQAYEQYLAQMKHCYVEYTETPRTNYDNINALLQEVNKK